jgi:hypothetical protein
MDVFRIFWRRGRFGKKKSLMQHLVQVAEIWDGLPGEEETYVSNSM